MRNFDDWGCRLIIGVVFFAATAALCVDAEGQQQVRPSGSRPNVKGIPTPKRIILPKNGNEELQNNNSENDVTKNEKIIVSAEPRNLNETPSTSHKCVYSTEPFDLNVKRLPPMYFGHDPEVIFENVKRLTDIDNNKVLIKKEFETSKEWERRVGTYWSTLSDRILVGNVKFSSTLAFAVIEEKISCNENIVPLISKYDADHKTMSFTAQYNNNATGFTTKTRIQGTELTRGYWGCAYPSKNVRYTFCLRSISKEIGQILKGKVGVLCLCKLQWRKLPEGGGYHIHFMMIVRKVVIDMLLSGALQTFVHGEIA